MKFVCFLCALIVSNSLFSQNDFKLSSYYLSFQRARMYETTQSFDQFSNLVDEPDFFVYRDSVPGEPNAYFKTQVNGFAGEVSFERAESPWRLLLGANLATSFNQFYHFESQERHLLDTVVAPNVLFISNDGINHSYVTVMDSFRLDSGVTQDYFVISRTTAMMLHGEWLRDFKFSNYTASIGLGLSTGMSIQHEISAQYQKMWTLGMVHLDHAEDYHESWSANLPSYNPVGGSPTEAAPLVRDWKSTTGKTLFYIKPYVPIRLEVCLAKKGFFSHLGLMGAGSAGFEFQMTQGAGVSNRFFWSWRLGLFWKR